VDGGQGAGRARAISFGTYVLLPEEKVLKEGRRTVPLGGRAFDILIALVGKAGHIVTKKDLMDQAWPQTIVADNNLRVHVAAIRKMLGDGVGSNRFIINVPGRGYSFIAPVENIETLERDSEPPPSVSHDIPNLVAQVLGRNSIIQSLVEQIPGQRLLTIVGSGGVGKTTVAIAVARQVAQHYERVCFVDLSSVEDPGAIPGLVASTLGVPYIISDPLGNAIARLRNHRYLIVLDNCEHVISNVATVVENLLRGTSGIDILATSREPMDCEGECVYNLMPLAIPRESDPMDAVTALKFPAVQLFVERAYNELDTFELTDANAVAVVEICRRLDGIPLAIELVAACVSIFGVEGLRERFGDDLILATRRRMTADARHRSLKTTLEWSYQLLSAAEQAVLRRLSVFRGAFNEEAAASVLSGDARGGAPFLDSLLSLVTKNLMTTDVSGTSIRFRLLHITRAYASALLLGDDERHQMQKRHAEYIEAVLSASMPRWGTTTRQQWRDQYDGLINDATAAMDWAFSARGNVIIGAQLMVAALPFGFHFSLPDEFLSRAKIALDALADVNPRRLTLELYLTNVLGTLLHIRRIPDVAVQDVVDKTLALVPMTGDPVKAIEPLTNATVYKCEQGEYAAALDLANEIAVVASSTDNPLAKYVANRVSAQMHHYVGSHGKARVIAESVLGQSAGLSLAFGQTQLDPRVSMRIILARISWLEGFPDRAADISEEAVDLASNDGPIALCQATGLAAVPIAFWRGDYARARTQIEVMLEQSRRFALDRWTNLALCYGRCADLKQAKAGSHCSEQFEHSTTNPAGALYRDMLSTISAEWIDAATLARAEYGKCGWANAEILRAASVHAGPARSRVEDMSAERTLQRALEISRAQGERAWELRALTSLTRLRRSSVNLEDAVNPLATLCAQFSEGYETADLREARSLVAEYGTTH
jgi:predicted ATPase/DNA-binding winged helix-turn-helix (wHTH) protein